MKKLALAALGALMMAGTTAAMTAPAEARVVVGIGIGGPGYYPSRFCDPYSYYYDPYRCREDRYYSDFYYDPIFFGGAWYRGPFRYRYYHGYRQFWVNGGWHRHEWRGPRPGHITFRSGWNGGHSSSNHNWNNHNWGSHSGNHFNGHNGHHH